MRYLIDGHNLIAKLPDISLDDPNDEIELILRLKSWAAASRKRKVTVYFDGGLPGGIAHRLSTSDIKVIFAPEGKTADALIIKHIHKINNPPEYTIITSDRQIVDAAERQKIPNIRSERFSAQISREKQKRSAPSPELEEPALNEAEVAEWLEIFGPEPKILSGPKSKKRLSPDKPQAPKPKPRRSPQELKTTDRNLDEAELDEWMNLFKID